MTIVVFTCEKCAGKNVEQKTWIDPNTDHILDVCDEVNSGYCRDCEDFTTIKMIEFDDNKNREVSEQA